MHAEEKNLNIDSETHFKGSFQVFLRQLCVCLFANSLLKYSHEAPQPLTVGSNLKKSVKTTFLIPFSAHFQDISEAKFDPFLTNTVT